MLDFSNITKEFITPSPKEKAQELVNTFTLSFSPNIEEAKQCTLLAVDEILKVVNPFKVSYWKKVKEEINKL